MKKVWFRWWRGLLLPVHGMGVLVVVLAVAFMIPVCFALCCNSYPLNDDLYHLLLEVDCREEKCVHSLIGFTCSFFLCS